ncbi:MAG TPA: alpha/beta hydrolase [Acidimicrobiales bacterium]|nr:alpha/beta hydrolase [Acidimicrobiales bacterium]
MPTQQVNGADIHYEREGSGPPLVMVHGSWGDSTGWLLTAPILAERFEVITYDRRGHGQSTAPPGQGRRSEDEDDLVGLVEALRLSPANVSGNSFGASIVLGAAARRPEVFTRVSGHEPPLLRFADAVAPDLVEEQRGLMGQVYALLEEGRTAEGAESFVDNVAFGPGAWQELPDPVQQLFLRHAATFLDEGRDPDWDDLDVDGLAAYPGRVLVSQGAESLPWFWKVIDVLAERVPTIERTTMEQAGHVPQMTNPAELAALLTEFFES